MRFIVSSVFPEWAFGSSSVSASVNTSQFELVYCFVKVPLKVSVKHWFHSLLLFIHRYNLSPPREAAWRKFGWSLSRTDWPSLTFDEVSQSRTPGLTSIRRTAHTLINHRPFVTPGWQFVVGPRFELKPESYLSKQRNGSSSSFSISKVRILEQVHLKQTTSTNHSIWTIFVSMTR